MNKSTAKQVKRTLSWLRSRHEVCISMGDNKQAKDIEKAIELIAIQADKFPELFYKQ